MGECRAVLLAGLVVLAVAAGGCRKEPGELLIQQYIVCQTAARAAAPPEARREPLSAKADWPALLAGMDKPLGPEQPAAPAGKGESAETQPAGTQPEHWSRRRGPAYPGDWLHSLGRDAKELLPTMWDDTKATFTDPWALVGLGAAGVVGIVTNAAGCDNTVGDHYTKNGSQLNSFWDTVGDVGGNPGAHFAFAGAMYFTSLATGDVKAYQTSKALTNALAINGLTTLALKGLTRTRSPNGDPCGWPSGHASSSFCFATVMYEAYGPVVGIPLFAFASFVGYERIDARNHDFSDVLSGALIGVAIGHAVMQNHKPRILGFEVVPWADPANGSVGVALSREF